MNPVRKLLGSDRFQIWMRKRSGFLRLTNFLAGYSLRPFLSTDLRLFRLLYCMQRTRTLPFPIAEVGVGSGYGMVFILTALRDTKDTRKYLGFDTFEGFPYIHQADLEGMSEHRKEKVTTRSHYAKFDIGHMRRVIRACRMENQASLHKGRFEETLPTLPADARFSFVYLDCDLYQSYITSLTHLYDRVVDGGILLFDEYEHTEAWPGARKAIDEFFADKLEKPEPLSFGTSWMVIKGKRGGEACRAVA